MDIIVPQEKPPTPVEERPLGELKKIEEVIEVTSNWKVVGTRNLRNTVTTILHEDFSGSMALEDIAHANTCIEIQRESSHEPCTVDIKMRNGKKIVRMGISSEASILEIFKESGEYATTIFSEFVHELEGCTVYLGGVVFEKPTHEAGIRFTRVNNERSSIYVYGIRLVLEDAKPSQSPPPEELDYSAVMSDFLSLVQPRKMNLPNTMSSLALLLKNCERAEKKVERKRQKDNESEVIVESDESRERLSDNNNDSPKEESPICTKKFSGNLSSTDISILEKIVETHLRNLEARLMKRLHEVETKTNTTLEEILNKLDKLMLKSKA